MRTITLLSLTLSLLLHSGISFSATKEVNITYFETNQYPLINIDRALKNKQISLEKIDLDILKNIEKKMSINLPDTEKEAEKIIKKRMSSISDSVKKQINESIKGHFLLIKWDIKKLPALVFNDGEYVIYGLTDINDAITIYKEYKRGNDE